ncbi:MAG: type 4a pilus biogenesis protein PilO [Acidobacteria bacterium]|nr:type 4a pilus biogenesis protein PilO [Acidobacteriota bacterium]
MTKSFKFASRWIAEPGPLRKVRIVLAALFLFDVVFYLFAIGPLGESDRNRAQQLANIRRQVADRSKQVQTLSAIVGKVETARTEGDKLLGSLTMPRRTAFSAIVSELDQAGKMAGVELRERTFEVEPIEGSDTLSMMTVTGGLQGSYDSLVKFLNLLDKSQRFLIIQSLGAAPQQSGAQSGGALNVTIKLDAFVRET